MSRRVDAMAPRRTRRTEAVEPDHIVAIADRSQEPELGRRQLRALAQIARELAGRRR
jgi:hypothetical protein